MPNEGQALLDKQWLSKALLAFPRNHVYVLTMHPMGVGGSRAFPLHHVWICGPAPTLQA